MEDIIILGYGGHAKSIVDIVEQEGIYNIKGFVTPTGREVDNYRGHGVIASDKELPVLYDQGIKNAIIGIGFMGNSKVRNQLYNELKKIGYYLPTVIDNTAIIAKDVSIEEGTVVGKGCIINSDSRIGKMTIINTHTVIEHECRIGAFSHIAVSSVLCGGVKVGNETFVGANTTVKQGVEIGNNVIIGMGSVVLNNVKNKTKCMGLVK